MIFPKDKVPNANDSTNSSGRQLWEQYTDPGTMSNKCKALCIDENKNFCANSNFSGGYCCEFTEIGCPRADLCSEDNPKAPASFKYLACPNESACEGK